MEKIMPRVERNSSVGPTNSASSRLRLMSAMYMCRRWRESSVMKRGLSSGRSSRSSRRAESMHSTLSWVKATSSRSNGWSSMKAMASTPMLMSLAIWVIEAALEFQLICG
jgi:hypothetical protein